MALLCRSWPAERVKQEMVAALPPSYKELRTKLGARILERNFDGQALYDLILRTAVPGSPPLGRSEAFTSMFGDLLGMWPKYSNSRTPEEALDTLIMKIVLENCSVAINEAKKTVFNVIPQASRVPAYDTFYDSNASWIISCGEQRRDHDAPRVHGSYVAPSGWLRLALDVREYDKSGGQWQSWHKAYHGTGGKSVASIVQNGLIKPGSVTPEGKQVENLHGKAGAKGNKVPIYLSPSIEYSAHFVYTTAGQKVNKGSVPQFEAAAEAEDLSESLSGLNWQQNLLQKDGTYAQFVFEVRVRPGSYRVQRNTLSRSLWPDWSLPFEPNVASDNLEWLVEDSNDVMCTGVMIRQLPCDPKTFNERRIAQMKQLVDWDDSAKKPRSARDFGFEGGQVPARVAWEYNNEPATGHTLSTDSGCAWARYSAEDSAAIEHSYQQYQRYCFIGTPKGAMGALCIDFRRAFDSSDVRLPIQLRADPDRNQTWRQRAVRRVAQ